MLTLDRGEMLIMGGLWAWRGERGFTTGEIERDSQQRDNDSEAVIDSHRITSIYSKCVVTCFYLPNYRQ